MGIKISQMIYNHLIIREHFGGLIFGYEISLIGNGKVSPESLARKWRKMKAGRKVFSLNDLFIEEMDEKFKKQNFENKKTSLSLYKITKTDSKY